MLRTPFRSARLRLEDLEPRDVPAAPVIPETPSVPTTLGTLEGNTRIYDLTASQFTQQIANFPIRTAQVWGYNGSTPGPTLVAYEGETVRVVIRNQLPEATTVHFHGMHQPNEDDGVAGISQPNPIQPGETYTYEFLPGHAGTFAYHSHTNSAPQELRGLDGSFIILPRDVPDAERVDRDFVMNLQQFSIPGEGKLVDPFPPGTGDFPFSTINGKTGDASGGTINVRVGDKIRIRLYNASNLSHSMHLHGQHYDEVARNGHPQTPLTETTVNLGPGEFVDIEFAFNQPGNWIFHCHVPHHTSNMMQDGYNGAPVGMTRVFHTEGYAEVAPEYFTYTGPKPPASPGPALVSGPPDGTARVLAAVGGQLSPGGQVNFFPGFTGAISVASADLSGDNVPDYIAGAGPGGGPRVKVVDGKTGATLADFFAYDAGFRGGVNITTGDVNGDGTPDIIVGTGAGGGPHVKVFDGRRGAEIRSFFAYAPDFLGGTNVAAGDVDGDGFADIITGAGSGAPHLKVFDGGTGNVVRSFYAGDPNSRGGIRVAAKALDPDSQADLLVGANGRVIAYSGEMLFLKDTPPEMDRIDLFDGFQGNVFVG